MFLSMESNQKRCATILADIWRVKYVWDTLKEKLRGCQYSDMEPLKNNIKKR
jgi:hypothetical protein